MANNIVIVGVDDGIVIPSSTPKTSSYMVVSMIILTDYLDRNTSKSLTRIFKQHNDDNSSAFAADRKTKECYFLEENGDSALLLSRLFQKYGSKISAYYVSDTIMPSDIPQKYYNFVKNGFNNGDFINSHWFTFKATKYADLWKIFGYSCIDIEEKTNGELWNQIRKENKIKFGFQGDINED